MTAVDSNKGLEERREYFFKYLRISACVFLLGQNFFAYNFRSKLRLCVCGFFLKKNAFIYSECCLTLSTSEGASLPPRCYRGQECDGMKCSKLETYDPRGCAPKFS